MEYVNPKQYWTGWGRLAHSEFCEINDSKRDEKDIRVIPFPNDALQISQRVCLFDEALQRKQRQQHRPVKSARPVPQLGNQPSMNIPPILSPGCQSSGYLSRPTQGPQMSSDLQAGCRFELALWYRAASQPRRSETSAKDIQTGRAHPVTLESTERAAKTPAKRFPSAGGNATSGRGK